MKLTFHGGLCCGIKTIYRLGVDPNLELNKDCFDGGNADQLGAVTSQNDSFFNGEVPKETCKERLDRFIKYCDKHRPYGVIEIALAESCYSWMDQSKWFPLLRRRGFRCVTNCYNSNSGNRIHIFHRKTDKE